MLVYVIVGIVVFVLVIVLVFVMVGYYVFFVQKQKIGMVDIVGILEISEVVFIEMFFCGCVFDVDCQVVYDLVWEIGLKFDVVIVEL